MDVGFRVCAVMPDDPDMAEVLALRADYFRQGQAEDRDRFDPLCRHFLVRDPDGRAVASYRLLPLDGGRALDQSYTAQFYDLSPLAGTEGLIVELGRFAMARDRADPEIVRAAWAQLTRMVDNEGVVMFLGCSSFAGTDPARHAQAFEALARRSVGPAQRLPRRRADEAVPLSALSGPGGPGGAAGLPPMLRAYLSMGGWVGDHVVIDRDLGTCHIFTALDIAAIPESRKRLMRAAAAGD